MHKCDATANGVVGGFELALLKLLTGRLLLHVRVRRIINSPSAGTCLVYRAWHARARESTVQHAGDCWLSLLFKSNKEIKPHLRTS